MPLLIDFYLHKCKFVNACQKVSVTVKREFMEEALDSTGAAKVNMEDLWISNNIFVKFRKMWEHSPRWLTSSLREGRRCTGVDFLGQYKFFWKPANNYVSLR